MRKISQETFDEVVEENINDFEMSKEEALADTIKQFQSQGVDLSGIDTSGGIGRQELLDHIKTMEKYLCLSKDQIHMEEQVGNVVQSLQELKRMCLPLDENRTPNKFASRNQHMFQTNGGLATLHSLLKISADIQVGVYSQSDSSTPDYPLSLAVHLAAVRLLNAVCKNNVENRDFFEPGGSVVFVELIRYYVGKFQNHEGAVNAESLSYLGLVLEAVKLCRVVSKTEFNKATLMKKGLGEIIIQWLEYMVTRSDPSTAAGTVFSFDNEQNAESYQLIGEVSTEICFMLKALCIHDDERKEMSCAYENGKTFMASSASTSLLSLAKMYYCAPTVAGSNIATAALLAAKQLITSEESVQVMSKHGAMELPLLIYTQFLLNNNTAAPLKENENPTEGGVSGSVESAPTQGNLVTIQLLRAVTGVMRNLCADDVRKNILVKDGTLRALLCVMNSPECVKDLNFMEQAVGCLAMITLRSPYNSVFILSAGCDTVEIVLKAMYYQMNKQRIESSKPMPKTASPAAFLRQGCLFFRNVAARCVEQRDALLQSTNVEQVLKQVGLQYPSCVDEAYGALRDFNVDIKRVKVNAEDGTVEAAYEAFGEGTKKSGFNPVFENSNAMDSDDMQARIQDHASAPFSGQGGL